MIELNNDAKRVNFLIKKDYKTIKEYCCLYLLRYNLLNNFGINISDNVCYYADRINDNLEFNDCEFYSLNKYCSINDVLINEIKDYSFFIKKLNLKNNFVDRIIADLLSIYYIPTYNSSLDSFNKLVSKINELYDDNGEDNIKNIDKLESYLLKNKINYDQELESILSYNL